MTDFSESYANKLLKGIMRYSHDHDPWVVCKMPLSLRDNGRMDEVVKFAEDWNADAIIGQFLPNDDVDAFGRHGASFRGLLCADAAHSSGNRPGGRADYGGSPDICLGDKARARPRCGPL